MTDRDLLARAAALSTATLSDALDSLRLPGALAGLTPLHAGDELTGPAFTVAYQQRTAGTVGDFLDDVPAGAVVAIANRGRTDCTVWGGIMTAVAADRSVAGTVVDGICRDTRLAADARYPVFSRGRWVRTGKDRVELEAVAVPVLLAGVRVAPGDLLRGDADGVVAVPAPRLSEIVEIAERIDRAEQHILERAMAGEPLASARADLGYHTAQRPL